MSPDLWLHGRDPGPARADIVIPVYNQLDYTRACLASLAAHTAYPHRVLLVDNGSTDGTPEFLATAPYAPECLQVLRNERNLGFTRAANQGLRVADARYVVLLNNDTTVLAGWLTGLIGTAESDDRIGVVGPRTLNPATGRIHNVGGLVFYQGRTALPWGQGALRGDLRFQQVLDCQYIEGSCMLIKRRVIETIGLFDEVFSPGYYEDSDYCFRAREAGFRCVFSPLSEIYHYASVTASAMEHDGRGLSVSARRNEQVFRARWAHRFAAEPEVTP